MTKDQKYIWWVVYSDKFYPDICLSKKEAEKHRKNPNFLKIERLKFDGDKLYKFDGICK